MKPVRVKLAGTEREYVPTSEPGCEDCYFKGRKVGGRGDPASPFVIVGESPGIQELVGGVPFIGPSGDMVEQLLAEHNIPPGSPESPYITNAFKCFPRKKDQSTLPVATQRCHSHLIDELQAHPRKVILALGASALWSLTNNYGLKITKERGKVFKSPLAERGIVASTHPAFLLRGGGNLKQFRDDFRLAIELLRGRPDPVPSWERISYTVVTTPYQVQALAEQLNALTPDDVIGADHETAGFSFLSDPLLSCGFMFGDDRVYIVPGELSIPALYTSPAKYVWHNGKFDVKFNWIRGEPARVDEDTMLMSYALNERRGIHDLEQVASDHLGHPNWKAMLEEHIPYKGASYSHIPRDILYRYQAYDINSTRELYFALRPKVASDPSTERLYTSLLIPASQFLAKVESRGIEVDQDWTVANDEYLSGECDRLEKELNEIAKEEMGHEVNPRSPIQMKSLLYDTLKLGPNNKGTDEDTLKGLPKHPAVTTLMGYRTVQKQHATYTKSLLYHKTTKTGRILKPRALEFDGRVHPTFLLHGTATGRLASRGPNMQNQPRDPLVRGQFVAGEGKIFLEPDLSQAELRSLACLSGDPALLEIFCATDRSLHNEVAAELFGADFDEEQKMIAKNINFGIVYGITMFGLLDQLETAEPPIKGYTARDCQEWIDGWGRRFPIAWEYIQRCKASVRRGETITTIFGRKKRHGVIAMERLKDLENEASNFPHQSIASDIVLTTGTRIDDYIYQTWGAEIVNLVHDSMLIQIDREETRMRECCAFVMEQMVMTPRMMGLTRVPFKSEAKVGYRWGSAKAAAASKVDRVRTATDFQKGWDPLKDPLPFPLAA